MDRAGNAFAVAVAASASVNNVTITRSSLASGYATISRIFPAGNVAIDRQSVWCMLLDCLLSDPSTALSTYEGCLSAILN